MVKNYCILECCKNNSCRNVSPSASPVCRTRERRRERSQIRWKPGMTLGIGSRASRGWALALPTRRRQKNPEGEKGWKGKSPLKHAKESRFSLPP